jgi:phage-related protein
MAVRINVVGKADLKEFDRAQKKIKAMRDEALKAQPGISGAMARAGDSMQRFGNKTKNVGTTLSKNLTVPLALAGAALYKFTENAAQDAQQQAILAKTLQNTTGATRDQIASVEEWITAQGKALGVADDALRPALATLAGSFGDIAKAQDAARLAMDIAAARGVPVETAAKAIAKANAGQTSQLSKLVPGLDKATVATGDWGKISAEVATIVGGQAANAADTAAGAMERNKVAMDEAMESIGYAFIPIMEDFNAILQDKIVPAIQGVADWFGRLSPNTRKVIVVIAALVAVLGPLLVIIGSVISSIGVIAGAFAAVSLPVIAVVAAIAAVIAIMVVLYKKNETFRNFVLAMWAKIKIGVAWFVEWFKNTAWPFIKKVFDQWVVSMKIIWAVVKVVFTAIWAYIKFVFNSIKTAFALFSAVLKGDWSKAWNIIKGIFTSIFSKLGPIAKAALDKVVNFVKGLGGRIKTALGNASSWLLNAGKDLITGLWNGVKDKWDWLKDKITGLGKSITGWAKKALGIKSPSTVFAGIGMDIGQGLRNGIQASLPMVRKAALGMADTATMTTSLNLAGVSPSPVAVGGMSSNTVTVAPGAVQITINGSDASAGDTKQIVDAAFAKLVRELRAR